MYKEKYLTPCGGGVTNVAWSDTPCRIWEYGRTAQGYGSFYAGGGREEPLNFLIHRFVYEALIGPIPEGMDLDHLCHTRPCWNEHHLEPVTRAENVMRGEGICANNARKVQCHRGHAFTSENTMIKKRTNRAQSRECRTCHNERRNRCQVL